MSGNCGLMMDKADPDEIDWKIFEEFQSNEWII